jgi:hypothetical protein
MLCEERSLGRDTNIINTLGCCHSDIAPVAKLLLIYPINMPSTIIYAYLALGVVSLVYILTVPGRRGRKLPPGK